MSSPKKHNSLIVYALMYERRFAVKTKAQRDANSKVVRMARPLLQQAQA
jgi:hypothetical protein